MARSRSPFGSFLAVLAGIAIAIGLLGWWADRTVANPQTFSSLAADLLAQPAIVSRLASAVVDPAIEQAPPAVRQQRAVIVATTRTVLSDARFVPLFEDALREVHHELVDGNGAVRLQLQPALDAVVVQVRKVSPQVAAQLADVTAPQPTLLSAGQASRIRSVVDLLRGATIAFLVGGAILLVIAVIGAGPRALLPFGVTLAVLCALILLLIYGVRGLVDVQVSGPSQDAATSAFGVVVSNLKRTLIVATIAGVACAIVGGVVKRRAA
jgi:hypothetical protein